MTEPTWTCTRSQLTDALCRLTAEIPLDGQPTANLNAESMAEAILAQLAPVRTFTEYAVAWRDEDPNRDAVVEFYDDEQDAAEHAALYPGGYPVRRPVFCGLWERVPEAVLDGPEQAAGTPGLTETGLAKGRHGTGPHDGPQGRETAGRTPWQELEAADGIVP
jgi:hypothetical protein